jgi:predicted Fe-Mo cluster-binding NifX family protein
MRIAMTVWNDRISPLMDAARQYWIVETGPAFESGALRTEIVFEDDCYLHRRSLRLRGMRVDVVICGAVSRHFQNLLRQTGIELIDGISGPAEEVLQAYMEGRLSEEKYRLPGHEGPTRRKTSLPDP